MKTSRLTALALVAFAAMSGATLTPSAAAAQSQLDVADAQAFLGKWAIDMDSDMGPISLELEITDMSGKVGASVGSPDMGGMQDVTDISRSDESLVLNYEANAQGQYFNVALTLEPDGDGLTVLFDVADGMFLADGVATRAD